MIPSPEVREVPIKEYLGMIRKRVRLIIGLMLAIVVFFISYYFFFPKTYVAKTTILIKKAGLRLMDPKKDPMTSGKGDYQDQLRLLHSGFLVERIARKLDQPLLTPKKLLSMVSIDPVFRTSMVEISVKGRDPVQIAEIANAWAREFIYQDMERKMGIAEYGVSRLEDQISETLVELQKAEKELDVFVTKYGVLAEREQLVDRLKAQKIRLEQELVNLSVRYKEKHLRIVSLNGQLTKVTKQIREENQKLLMLKEKMAAYKVLVKRADAYRQIYSELIQRSKQLDTARGLVVSDIGIIDTARVPKVPLGLPGKMIFILLAGGLFSGILLCFVLEYFDSSLKAAEEVEFYAKIPFLGEIPLADEFAEEGIKDLSLIYHIKTYSQTGQAFKCLEESLLFSFREERPLKTFLVCSAVPGEGKTFTASNLGAVFAHEEEPVLMVDANMRSGNLSRVFNASKEKGLSDILNGDCRLEEAVIGTPVPGLFLLPSGPLVSNPIGLLESEEVAGILRGMEGMYHRIIIDITSISIGPEALILGNKCDGVVFVINKGGTRLEEITKAKKSMEIAQAKILGAVLNNAGIRQKKWKKRGEGRVSGYFRSFQTSLKNAVFAVKKPGISALKKKILSVKKSAAAMKNNIPVAKKAIFAKFKNPFKRT